MDEMEKFRAETASNIDGLGADKGLQDLSRRWVRDITPYKYAYNFSFMGRPIIQFPQDMVAVQELILQVKPDLIIETGIAHGGSLVMSASMLSLLDYCEAAEAGKTLDPRSTRRRVLGIDVDIRAHNRAAIEAHPLSHRIDMIQGSSVAAEIVARVREIAAGYKKIMVCLDSNHTHEHVLAELEAYAPLVTNGSYCIVFDTVIEDMPDGTFSGRPWNRGNNPKTAVLEYMRLLKEPGRDGMDGRRMAFEIDDRIDNKLLITAAPGGYLRRVK